jgi:hypothetical protein
VEHKLKTHITDMLRGEKDTLRGEKDTMDSMPRQCSSGMQMFIADLNCSSSSGWVRGSSPSLSLAGNNGGGHRRCSGQGESQKLIDRSPVYRWRELYGRILISDKCISSICVWDMPKFERSIESDEVWYCTGVHQCNFAV